MRGSFITLERCGTCKGNIECDEVFVPGTLANLRTWHCIMCGREKHPAELRSFKDKLLAKQVPSDDPNLSAFVWDKELQGVY